MSKNLGTQLGDLRRAKGLTVEAAAQLTGLTVEQVERIESGHGEWTTAVLYAARAFRMVVRVHKGKRLRGLPIAQLALEAEVAPNTCRDVLSHCQLPRPAFASPYNPRISSIEAVLAVIGGRLELV